MAARHAERAVAGAAPGAEAVAGRQAELLVLGVVDRGDAFGGDPRAVPGGDQLAALVAAIVQQQPAEAGQLGRAQEQVALRHRVAEGAGVPLGIVDGERAEDPGHQVVADAGAGRGAQRAGRHVRAGAGVAEVAARLMREGGREEVRRQVGDHDRLVGEPGMRAP